jgi:hypothetical protein
LTRRANHLHYCNIAQLLTADGIAKRLLARLQAKIPTIELVAREERVASAIQK